MKVIPIEQFRAFLKQIFCFFMCGGGLTRPFGAVLQKSGHGMLQMRVRRKDAFFICYFTKLWHTLYRDVAAAGFPEIYY